MISFSNMGTILQSIFFSLILECFNNNFPHEIHTVRLFYSTIPTP